MATNRMATSPALSSPFLSSGAPTLCPPTQNSALAFHYHQKQSRRSSQRRANSFKIQAAKLPPGVVLPTEQPQFQAPFLGFTRTAEIWNSRACMIGLIGTFIVELILNKGILQVIGVEIGKGLDIPL